MALSYADSRRCKCKDVQGPEHMVNTLSLHRQSYRAGVTTTPKIGCKR